MYTATVVNALILWRNENHRTTAATVNANTIST